MTWLRIVLILVLGLKMSLAANACFDTTQELYAAVDAYLAENSSSVATSTVAQTYGYPMGSWCVDQLEDLSELFCAYEFLGVCNKHSNLNARSFNEDLAAGNVSRARDMSRMFLGARVFNQDLST